MKHVSELKLEILVAWTTVLIFTGGNIYQTKILGKTRPSWRTSQRVTWQKTQRYVTTEFVCTFAVAL